MVSTSAVPTGRMVIDPGERFPELSGQLDLIDAAAREGFYLDAQALSERLFGDHMPANMLLLGAAYQRGALPVSVGALEQAIRLNGAGVEKNLAAFGWGRAVAAFGPDACGLGSALRTTGPVPGCRPARDPGCVAVLGDTFADDPELHALVQGRAAELVEYQGSAYARRYVEFVVRAHAAGSAEVTAAVARNLFKLMAYKDEYEVARLHLDAVEQVKLREEFGEEAKVWFNLHPPLLRALGLRRKLKLGGWFVPAFRALRGLRRLRGTAFDPFGYARVRRTERALIGEYERLVEEALARLTPETHATAVELCELPDVIRGYEEIKLRNVERFRERAAELRTQLGPATPSDATGPVADPAAV